MDQIRFSRPVSAPTEPKPEPVRNPAAGQLLKTVLKAILALVIIAVIIFAAVYLWRNQSSSPVAYDPTASEYYAVFLTNGQVYFGKPVSKDSREFVFSDVYYLQITDSATTAQEQLTAEPRFTLVKLGQEIHGPTDKLFVNMANVLFYEQLKTDSKVVASIKNQKQ